MNEAAIFAARRDLKEISKEEIADALEAHCGWPLKKKGAVMSDHKKKLVAYHEVSCCSCALALMMLYMCGKFCLAVFTGNNCIHLRFSVPEGVSKVHPYLSSSQRSHSLSCECRQGMP